MAAKVFVGGFSSGNWNANLNWLGGAFAVAGDTVTFALTANPCVVNVASACTSIDFTGFTGTFTMSNTMTLTGNITLSISMTVAGTSTLIMTNTCTMTANGNTWSGAVTLGSGGSSFVCTIGGGDWLLTGLLTTAGSAINIAAGNKISAAGGLTSTTGAIGNGKIELRGGTWSGTGAVAVTLDLTGNVTLSGTNLGFLNKTLTWNSGAITTTGSLLTIGASATTTLNLGGASGCVLNSLTLGSGNPQYLLTLSSDCYLNGSLVSTGNGATLGTSNMYVAGDLTATGPIAGSVTVTWNGSGTSTWSGASAIGPSLTFNGSGTLNFTGTITKTGNTITYTAGTIAAGSSTFSFTTSPTLNTNGMSFFNVTFAAALTPVINSLLTITGTLSIGGNCTFGGTSGITAATWSIISAGSVVILLDGVTYTCTTSYTNTGTNASPNTFRNVTASGTKAVFTLSNGAAQSVSFVTARDVDSSLGQTIWDFLGSGATLTRALNWNNGVRPAAYYTISIG